MRHSADSELQISYILLSRTIKKNYDNIKINYCWNYWGGPDWYWFIFLPHDNQCYISVCNTKCGDIADSDKSHKDTTKQIFPAPGTKYPQDMSPTSEKATLTTVPNTKIHKLQHILVTEEISTLPTSPEEIQFITTIRNKFFSFKNTVFYIIARLTIRTNLPFWVSKYINHQLILALARHSTYTRRFSYYDVSLKIALLSNVLILPSRHIQPMNMSFLRVPSYC